MFSIGETVRTDFDGRWKAVQIIGVRTDCVSQSGICYRVSSLRTSDDGWLDEAWFVRASGDSYDELDRIDFERAAKL